MATTNTSLAPSPKGQGGRSGGKADPVKEAISPIPGESDRANAVTERSNEQQSEPAHEDVAVRAYQCWHERGCPDGSPEVDWYRAENERSLGKNR